jgi:hypothetical protein
MQNEIEIAVYIGEICFELRTLAVRARMDLLAHMLAMAELECSKIAGAKKRT